MYAGRQTDLPRLLRRSPVNVHLRVHLIIAVVTVVLCVLIGGALSVHFGQSARLPDEITDQEFWRMVTGFSEPQGLYTGDNWISNEASIQNVIPPLKQLTKPGGVYLGVGPEQNFTYMWALQSNSVQPFNSAHRFLQHADPLVAAAHHSVRALVYARYGPRRHHAVADFRAGRSL